MYSCLNLFQRFLKQFQKTLKTTSFGAGKKIFEAWAAPKVDGSETLIME